MENSSLEALTTTCIIRERKHLYSCWLVGWLPVCWRFFCCCCSFLLLFFTLYVCLSNIILESFRSFLNFHHFQFWRRFTRDFKTLLIFGSRYCRVQYAYRLRRAHAYFDEKDAINNFNFQIITNLCGNFTYCTFHSLGSMFFSVFLLLLLDVSCR